MGSLVRSLVPTVVVVGGYYIAPFDGLHRSSAIIRLVAVFVVVGFVTVTSYRSVRRATRPTLRAIESIAVIAPIFIVGFGSVYGAISAADSAAFSERLDHTGALYLSVATSTTVGYGDIAATSDLARIAAMTKMASNVIVIGLTTRALLSAARRARGEVPT